MNYLDIKQILDKKSAMSNKGALSDQEIKLLVKEWHDTRTESELNEATVRMEMKAMESKIRKYNVPQLGEIPNKRDNGNIRILVCQMGGCASKEIREIKIAVVEKLIRQYNINVIVFLELNFNWFKVNLSANLASWLRGEEQETRCVSAHNTQERSELSSKH
jgi:peroxiredoxin family protein